MAMMSTAPRKRFDHSCSCSLVVPRLLLDKCKVEIAHNNGSVKNGIV
jgi:hypothetical protein